MTKKRKIIEETETQNKEKEEETESRWEKGWTQEEWLERINEKQKEMEEAEAQIIKRIEQSRKLQQGWEMMRLCKEMMKLNGNKWRKSKERRELERNRLEEREERIGRAQRLKLDIMEKEKKKQIQRRITES